MIKLSKMEDKKGFTLIELLVVMVILGILAVIGLSSFYSAQFKSRDAKRKADLGQVQRALEMYFNDYSSYPAAFSWGAEFKDVKGTVYMKETPSDPSGNPEYCYATAAVAPFTYYKLYAKLENGQDHSIGGPYTCGAENSYNYGVTSSNTTP